MRIQRLWPLLLHLLGKRDRGKGGPVTHEDEAELLGSLEDKNLRCARLSHRPITIGEERSSLRQRAYNHR